MPNDLRFPTTSGLSKKPPHKGSGLYYDALYGYTPFSPRIRRIIDLEVFQRLRGLKQLSVAYLVFPGAVHSRFEHSVGVAHLAGVVHERLRESLEAKLGPSDIHLNVVTLTCLQLAGLLHDIGHGPFCHVFEMFCKRNPGSKTWSHEEFGRRLLTGEGEGPIFRQIPDALNEIARELSNEGPPELLNLLAPENLFNIASGRAPDLGSLELSQKYHFLKDVIPSAFGCDRLDYLRRDAHYSGVNTGNIDVWEIISNLRVCEFEGRCGLFLNPAVAVALEALLSARSAVYRRVYHNPVHRCAQELMARALSELQIEPDALVLLTDSELLDLIRQEGLRGNRFLREIYERVKFRILYGVLELVPHAAVTDQRAILEHHRWGDLAKKESAIGSKANVEGRIFYDLERVPIIKVQDFEAKLFYDSVSWRPLSLFELQPHLAVLYKGVVPGQGLGKAEAFTDALSKICLFYPFEHIRDDVALAASKNASVWAHEAEDIYARRLRPLVESFFTDILLAESNDFSASIQQIEKRAAAYLLDLIGQTVSTQCT